MRNTKQSEEMKARSLKPMLNKEARLILEEHLEAAEYYAMEYFSEQDFSTAAQLTTIWCSLRAILDGTSLTGSGFEDKSPFRFLADEAGKRAKNFQWKANKQSAREG